MALRVFPKFLYGEGHFYSQPLTGSGYEKTVATLTREDMIKFYDTWFKPNNATLLVVGDIDLKTLESKIESRFDKWKKAEVPAKTISKAAQTKGNKLYLLDRPESEQSVVIAGYVTEPYGQLPEIEREALMNIFGSDFTSRLNMNLREDKHWSYGASGFVWDAQGQRPLLAYAPVQTDKTKESILEIKKEFKSILNDKPVTKEEFERTQNNVSMQLPGKWETNNSVRSSLEEMMKYNLPQDYFKTYSKKVKSMNLEGIQKLSKQMITGDKLSWFVVGDKDKILKGLKEAGFDEIIFVDADGNVIEPAKAELKSK
jgi:zinc protease